MSEPADADRRAYGGSAAWILRAFVGGLVSAAACGGIWYATGAPHPTGTTTCGAIAALATGWAAARSRRAGVFMLLICIGSTLTVVSAFLPAFPFGAAGFLLPILGVLMVFSTIRAWMKSEGYI